MWLQRWGFIAGAVAWLTGIALAALLGWVANLLPLLLGGVALLALAVALLATMGRRIIGTAIEAIPVALVLLALGLLGMARLVAMNPAGDGANVAHLIGTGTWQLQGTVVGEPDVRTKGEFLQVAVTSASSGSHHQSQAADGTVQFFAVGLPSQFAPDYGDTVEFTTTLQTPVHVPPGIDAEAGATQRLTILARGGGNHILATLYQMRAALARGLTASLPAPEAALLIGILLGLKTPTLRARLPLFVETRFCKLHSFVCSFMVA